MVVEFQNMVTINSSPVDVFDYLHVLENFPKWNHAITSVSKVDSNQDGKTPVYRIYREKMGPRNEEVSIVEYKKNEKIKMEVTGGWFKYTMTYDIMPDPNGVLLINTASIESSGVTTVVAKLLQGNVKNSVNHNLHVLKRIMEKVGM